MFEVEVLIIELGAINRLSTRTITSCKVTALNHELLDDSVESRPLVAQRLARFTNTFLAGAKSTKIVGCLGDNIVIQLEGNTAFLLVADGDVEVDAAPLLLGLCHGGQVCT